MCNILIIVIQTDTLENCLNWFCEFQIKVRSINATVYCLHWLSNIWKTAANNKRECLTNCVPLNHVKLNSQIYIFHSSDHILNNSTNSKNNLQLKVLSKVTFLSKSLTGDTSICKWFCLWLCYSVAFFCFEYTEHICS